MQDVIANSDQFSEIDELLKRHAVLDQTHADLQEQQVAKEAAMDSLQKRLQKLVKDKQNEILVKNSELLQAGETLEDAANVSAGLSVEIARLHAKKLDSVRVLGQVQMSIENIYQRSVDSYGEHFGKRKSLLDVQKKKREQLKDEARGKGRKGETGRKKTGNDSDGGIDENSRILSNMSELLENVGDRVLELQAIQDEFRESAYADQRRRTRTVQFSTSAESHRQAASTPVAEMAEKSAQNPNKSNVSSKSGRSRASRTSRAGDSGGAQTRRSHDMGSSA
eukprot:52247_1